LSNANEFFQGYKKTADHKIDYMPFEKFSKGIQIPDKKSKNSLYFIFKNDKLLLSKNKKGKYCVPLSKDFKELNLNPEELIYLGKYEGQDCFSGELQEKEKLTKNIISFELRETYSLIGLDFFRIAGYAFQITTWDKNSRYCGRCGESTKDMEEERAKICPKCNLITYPSISPAVIVAVIKKDMILLARARRFRRNLYSVLAGFAEVGENLEDCVKREIKEEIGIEVKNIKYFGSQPWPFPNSLMIAFTAEYDIGDISIDEEEILDAGWFKASDLPHTPGKPSIAKDLIDWFILNFS
jgi:NAD+ diphosphatase